MWYISYWQRSWTTLLLTTVLSVETRRSLNLQKSSSSFYLALLSVWWGLWAPIQTVGDMLLLISHFSDCILIERHKPINSLIASFGGLYFAASRLNGSLYHQKHAFYFREVKKWVDCLSVSFETPRSTLWLLTVLKKGGLRILRGNDITLARFGNLPYDIERRLHASWWSRWIPEVCRRWPPHQPGGDNVRYQCCTQRSKTTHRKSNRRQLW